MVVAKQQQITHQSIKSLLNFKSPLDQLIEDQANDNNIVISINI